MIIYLEGPRKVGKSFILKRFEHFKFNFIEYYDNFDLLPNEIGQFSIGKDLMALQLLNYLNKNIILDRGFVSSLVYGLLDNRFSFPYAIKIINLIINKYLLNNKIIYLYGQNLKKRSKDSFDNKFNYLEQEKIYNKIIDLLPESNVIKIKSKFNEESEKKIVKTIKELYEYRKF